MNDLTAFSVELGRWPEDADAIRSVREVVFVQEQSVPPDLEWDGEDERCIHALARSPDGTAIGTGRLAADGKIGRMAVLKQCRGIGVGDGILRLLIDEARAAGMKACYLHSQVHALPFYARHGFVAHGPEFSEADIPHREMVMEFDDE